MPKVQDILVLYQTSRALDVTPVAWARYEASKGSHIDNVGDEGEPPYHNAMAAMRDGWEVIQMSEYRQRSAADGYESGPFPYQTVLSRFSERQDERGAEDV